MDWRENPSAGNSNLQQDKFYLHQSNFHLYSYRKEEAKNNINTKKNPQVNSETLDFVDMISAYYHSKVREDNSTSICRYIAKISSLNRASEGDEEIDEFSSL
ncbi:hypothetical protein L2E82_40459 [Cichorium intybus]|uniref:Uncharacterized protein n=1 Tax=Cichorium intybus TaxID=13427 RepID=A0ACB9AM10_CICIN|nr:hypothetical protein L2E82_40459 [Cichorium intybus]